MPTFFEIIKQTLDRAYEDIDDDDKVARINECLDELQIRYNDVLAKGGPSYKDSTTRFAYVFRYSTAHADYLNSILNFCPELRKALKAHRVNISCLGGGPGSDVLGFLKFLLDQDEKPQLTYFILDKEPAWGETWADLDAIVSDELKTSRNYFPFDVTDPDSYEDFSRPFKSDIFTMLYFLSEVFKFKDDVSDFLETCFEKMKKGAFLVVLDFHDARLEDWIDEAAEDGGFECLLTHERRMTMDPIEEKSVLKEYIKLFGQNSSVVCSRRSCCTM